MSDILQHPLGSMGSLYVSVSSQELQFSAQTYTQMHCQTEPLVCGSMVTQVLCVSNLQAGERHAAAVLGMGAAVRGDRPGALLPAPLVRARLGGQLLPGLVGRVVWQLQAVCTPTTTANEAPLTNLVQS